MSDEENDSPHVVAVVQARLGSTRLPGKALADIHGRTMLDHVLDRLAKARRVDAVHVATTDEEQDDAIVAHCGARGTPVHRGATDDVLDRYHRAADAAGADVIVRITSDCPLLDPQVVDRVVAALVDAEPVDYASNVMPPRTWPRGLDTEALTHAALARAWSEAADPAEREHVTLHIVRRPEAYRIVRVDHDTDLSDHRWTVDTADDLELVRRIVGALDPDTTSFRAVLDVLDAHPQWRRINADVRQKEVD